MSEVTRLLEAAQLGDRHAAAQLLPIVYEELRKLAAARMAAERPGHTLDATALVHEAYLRLIGDQQFDSRGHFFAAAAEAMRRILIDRARQKLTAKAGGGRCRVDLETLDPAAEDPHPDLLELDIALEELERRHPRKAEVVKLRFFVGLTVSQVADTLGLSVSTAENDWAYARSWLRLRMAGQGDQSA